jgi:hypothetical protein
MNEPIKAIEPEHSVLADQAEEQRAKMLRELAEQRERMQASRNAPDESIGVPVEQELARMPQGSGEPADPNTSPTGAMVQDPDGRSPAEQRALGQRP